MPRYRLADLSDRVPMPDRGEGVFFSSDPSGEFISTSSPFWTTYYKRLIEDGDLVSTDAVPSVDSTPVRGTDTWSITRDGKVRPVSIDDLVAFLGGAGGTLLALSTVVFATGILAGAVLSTISAPSGWTVTAETTFGGRIGVSGTNLVAAVDLTSAATGTVRLRAASPDGLQSVIKTFTLEVVVVSSNASEPGGGPNNIADFADPNNAYLLALAA